MADHKRHRRMTSEEQARLSQSRYSRSADGAASSHSSADQSLPAIEQPKTALRSSAHVSYGHDAGRNLGDAKHASSRAEGSAAYSARRKKKRRGRVLKTVLIVLLVVVLGGAGAAFAYISSLDAQFNEDITDELREQLSEGGTVELQDCFYMLLLGVDKSEARAEDWGDSYANFRADTIILARIDPPNQKVTLVSIPRDTYADLGNGTKDKINAAYSLGGPAQMVKAVEKLAGVNISHYAEIDFEQFTSIVDTIGGITVNLPVALEDTYEEWEGLSLPAGEQTLDGETALRLCRSRHAYDKYGVGGDFYRAANQRMVIWAIVKKVLSLDAVSMATTVTQLASSVTTDFSSVDILSLALQFKNLDTDNNIYSGQLPTDSQYVKEIWYEYVKEDEWETMMERVDAGLPPYETEDQDFTKELAGTVGNGVVGDGETESAEEVEPSYSGTVLVLNGTSTQGYALGKANSLVSSGFSATADNYSSTDVEATKIVYNASVSTAYASALGVADALDIDSSVVEANDGTFSTNYDVVVLLGSTTASASESSSSE